MINMEEIYKLEKIACDVHPPLEQYECNGWLINFADGYTRRANSVLPISFDLAENRETSLSDFMEKIDDTVLECEELYSKKNLPCIFKITDATPKELSSILKTRGYKKEASTDVMIVSSDDSVFQERMESIIEPEETGVIMTSSPDEAWLNAFFAFENRADPKTKEIIKKQFDLVKENENLTTLYCRIQMTGKDVAVASVVIEDGVLFLLNVVVDEKCRGKGYGKILVKEILEAAYYMGAEKLCLQVVADNDVAKNLYKTFGFEYLYTYWYAVKKI